MTWTIRAALWGLAVAVLALLVASLAGSLHPLGDSLAVVRWQIACALALLVAILSGLGARWAVWLLLPASLVLGQTGWAWFQPQPTPDEPLVLYQKNLYYRLADWNDLERDIRLRSPDVLTLQEVSDANLGVLPSVADILPTQHSCRDTGVVGPAVASRWPAVEGTRLCHPTVGLAAIQVMTPDGPLWIASLHLPWPWPYQHQPHVESLVETIETLDGPVLIGGDFNMVPWSARNRRIAAAANARRIGRAHNTFPHFGPFFPLPIDNVYAPKGASGDTELRPLLGSDHRGVLARITLPGRGS